MVCICCCFDLVLCEAWCPLPRVVRTVQKHSSVDARWTDTAMQGAANPCLLSFCFAWCRHAVRVFQGLTRLTVYRLLQFWIRAVVRNIRHNFNNIFEILRILPFQRSLFEIKFCEVSWCQMSSLMIPDALAHSKHVLVHGATHSLPMAIFLWSNPIQMKNSCRRPKFWIRA